jgi:hypothetical protein
VKTVLGQGRLTWNAPERRTDRYGSVYLLATGDSTTSDFSIAPLTVLNVIKNTIGQLVAHVVETRQSTHIGDLFHGVFPTTPEVGEEIVLGEGALFTEVSEEGGLTWTTVGVKPTDGRHLMWLDIHALYRAHEQTVVLEFVTP